MRVLNTLASPQLALDIGTGLARACTDTSDVLERGSYVREHLGGAILYRRALRGGVVSDIAAAAEIIAPLVNTFTARWRRPAALICTPSDASPDEQDALVEAVSTAGATVTRIVPEPLAAAIGCGVDMSSEYAHLIVDLGEGVTDVAVIAGGSIVRSGAERTGFSDIRQAVVEWLRWQRRLVIDESAADALIRTFCFRCDTKHFEVRGHDIDRDDKSAHVIDREDLAAVIEPTLESISSFVASFVRDLPHETAQQVIESGLRITGGGATLDALLKRIECATGMNAIRAAQPLRSVINGARTIIRG